MFAPVQQYLQNKFFWDATVFQVSSFWHLMDQSAFETLGTTPSTTQWYISKDMNLQWHCHENLKCHNRFVFITHCEYIQRYTNCTLHPQLLCHGTSWITCHKCSIYLGVSIANVVKGKEKAIPLQAWKGPEGSRRLRLLYFKTVGTWRW
jgi:hypothetical protein